MANRLEAEFPEMNLRLTPPPIGPDGLQHDLEGAWREVGLGHPRVGDGTPVWRHLAHAVLELSWLLRRPPALTPHAR